MIGTTEIIILFIIISLFFGGRIIPALLKGIGKGVREFKDEAKGKAKDDTTASTDV